MSDGDIKFVISRGVKCSFCGEYGYCAQNRSECDGAAICERCAYGVDHHFGSDRDRRTAILRAALKAVRLANESDR